MAVTHVILDGNGNFNKKVPTILEQCGTGSKLVQCGWCGLVVIENFAASCRSHGRAKGKVQHERGERAKQQQEKELRREGTRKCRRECADSGCYSAREEVCQLSSRLLRGPFRKWLFPARSRSKNRSLLAGAPRVLCSSSCTCAPSFAVEMCPVLIGSRSRVTEAAV